MLPNTRAALLNALPAMPDNNARAMTVVYITAMSGEYLGASGSDADELFPTLPNFSTRTLDFV